MELIDWNWCVSISPALSQCFFQKLFENCQNKIFWQHKKLKIIRLFRILFVKVRMLETSASFGSIFELLITVNFDLELQICFHPPSSATIHHQLVDFIQNTFLILQTTDILRRPHEFQVNTILVYPKRKKKLLLAGLYCSVSRVE